MTLQGYHPEGDNFSVSNSPQLTFRESGLPSPPLPPYAAIIEALAYFLPRRKRRLFLTAIFKLRVNSAIKERELLQAHLYITRFTIRVLEVFGKDMP